MRTNPTIDRVGNDRPDSLVRFAIEEHAELPVCSPSGGEDVGVSIHRRTLIASATVVMFTAADIATVIRPRLDQLGTAASNAGGVALFVVGIVITIAALAPLAAVRRAGTLALVTISLGALVLGTALVLSFDQRDGSDGLFLFPLLLGAMVILALSSICAARLRRRTARA